MRVIRTLVSLVLAANIAGVAAGAWLNGGWQSRVLLTADTALVDGTNTDFPVLVTLSNLQYFIFYESLQNGHDIRFTGSDGSTQLTFERVSYNWQSQTAQFWVLMPTLSDASNTMYLYFGNGLATDASTTATWANYTAVYHYDDSPADGKLAESSPNAFVTNVSTSSGYFWTDTDIATGKIGTSWQYGPGKTVYSSTLFTTSTSWTVSAWVYLTNDGTDFLLQGKPGFFHITPSASAANEMQYKNDVSNQAGGIDIRAAAPVTALNQWNHVSFSMKASDSTVVFRLNGAAKAYNASYPTDGSTFPTPGLAPVPHGIDGRLERVGIGSTMYAQSGCEDCMQGYVDELRIVPVVTSADWASTEYNNQNAPATFLSFGAAQQFSGCD